jgi:hypothetical protein
VNKPGSWQTPDAEVFDAVAVFRFDRFARSVFHLARALDEFRALGIEVVSLHEAIDTSTPMGSAHGVVLLLSESWYTRYMPGRKRGQTPAGFRQVRFNWPADYLEEIDEAARALETGSRVGLVKLALEELFERHRDEIEAYRRYRRRRQAARVKPPRR